MQYHLQKSVSIVFFLLIFFPPETGKAKDHKQVQVKKINLTTNLINDEQIRTYFFKKAQEMYETNEITPFSELNKQISNEHCKVDLKSFQKVQGTVSYDAKARGVLIFGSFYKCSSCTNYHLSVALAFVIGEEGLCVTNNHVFSKDSTDSNAYLASFAMDTEWNVFPVEEVLAANKQDDVAIFKVKTNGVKLTPLSLGSDIETGGEVSIVSHPKKQYYTYTKGYVTRHYAHPKYSTPRFSITAEFAVGSSGAPVFDSNGKVEGIVSSTRYNFDNDRKNIQMVVKEVIPVTELMKLFNYS